MTFQSILFDHLKLPAELPEAPDFFSDLNLDQVVEAITLEKKEYHLEPFFYLPLRDISTIRYRHAVMQDMENPDLFEQITSFAQRLSSMRERLVQADKLYYPLQKKSWFLDAVEIYCDAINDLVSGLSSIPLLSAGFLSFREYLTGYAELDRFTALLQETQRLKNDLAAVKYSVLIKNNTVNVRNYEQKPDYAADVLDLFEKFKRDSVKDYRVKLPDYNDMNHVEAKILDFVALLNPELFGRLDNFYKSRSGYLDQTIGIFDREIQFYVAYLEFMKAFKPAGLQFCYPQLANPDKDIFSHEGYDLALAIKCLHEGSPIVTNDFYLTDNERIIVVSGPNQGGKTTFARTFGQLHYLASLGCPVPGREARLFIGDRIFTHFEKQEDINNLSGKLQNDLQRMVAVMAQATPDSIVILNEIFTSTTLEDAIFLSKEFLEKIIELDLLCVCVTFIDELSTISEKTISMVSTVTPEDPNQRTFKILRKPADGLSYALSIAEKYRLTYRHLKERLQA